MPGTAAQPRYYKLRGVNLFASGKYRGRTWLPSWLRNMADMGRKLGPSGARLHVPPAAPGHDNNDDWREFVPTDEPAAGWVDPDSLRAVPDPAHEGHLILKGDVVNVPEEMAQKIRTGEYRYGSAEVYDSFFDDFGNPYGKVLRKFSYLGGEVPQVKRLGPLPMPEPMPAPLAFSERAGVTIHERRVRRNGATHTYAETAVMDRQSMLAALKAAMPGVAQATLDPLTDEQLADLVKNLPNPTAAAAPAAPAAPAQSLFAEDPTREEMIAELVDLGEDQAELEAMDEDELGALYDDLTAEGTETEGAEGPPAVETMADPAAMPREELIAELTAQGQDAAALEAMDDAALRALYAELAGGEPAPATPAPAVATMSDRRRKPQAKPRRVDTMSEPRQVVKKAQHLNAQLDVALRRVQVTNRRQKVQDAQTFCDRLVGDGRATPALVQATILPALLALDDTRAVHKFSEGGRTRSLTAYELKKQELAKLPKVVTFGEKLPGAGGKPNGEAEEAAVRRFAETLSPAALRAGNYESADQFVSTFSECRKKKPSLTAKEYLGQ